MGYGDINAKQTNERTVALIWMIFGVGFYSFTIGNLASIISTIDKRAAHLQEKLQLMSEFVRRCNLPPEIEARMRRFIEINHVEHLQQFDQKKLLSELPSYLRGQVISHTHWGIVRKIRFFDNKSREFVWFMLPMLQPMKMYKKDILYSQGDPAEDIFFIIKGRVKFFYQKKVTDEEKAMLKERGISLPEPVPINLHVEGNYFGDNDVLINQGRDGRDSTAIAETEC